MSEMTRRRVFMIALLSACFMAGPVLAKDGESEGGSDNSGSGSSNSGSGGDDGDDEDDDDDSDSDNRSHREERRNDDQDRAIKAVRRGKAVSLQVLKGFLKHNYPGKILDVTLRKSSGTYFYNIRILAKGNRIKALTLNALTLKPRGP
jgi:hypothetical protein